MENLIVVLALLVCPMAMGLMMLFMMRGGHRDRRPKEGEDPAER